MPQIHVTLDRIDYALMALGGAVLLVHLGSAYVGGRHDQLRGAPIRPNRLTPLLVWLCFFAHVVGWTIGAQVARLATPSGLDGAARTSWQNLLTANLAQILVAVTCLIVGVRVFRNGRRGFGLGRRPFHVDMAYALAGWLAGLAACGLMAKLTMLLIHLLIPSFRFPDHEVFTVLEEPGANRWMRGLTIIGALLLAPISEELFFRGILQTGIKKAMPRRAGSMNHRWAAIGLTAILFAAMHSAVPHHIAALAVLGVLLGYLYERTGSLIAPILVHVMFNGKSLLYHELLVRFAGGEG